MGTNYGSKYGGTGKSTAYLSPSYGSPKPYTPSQRESSYTSNSRDKSYTPGAIPRDKAYTPGSREKSYTPGNRYSGYSVGGVGVRDRMQKFSGGDSRGSKEMYTPLHSVRGNSQSRDNPGWDKYSSRSAGSDPYANRTGTGYLSDYGGSNRSLASWDRASSRSGRSYDRPSRESSPVSSKLSSYGDYMSASPYSTYDSSPSLSRRYERQQSVDPPRREPDDSYTRRRDSTSDYIKPPAPKRREQITSDESDTNDSAPEAEKDGYKGRLKISRGTSPMHEGEPPRREQKKNKIRDRKAIARTKRIRNTTREIRRENIYKEFREMADAAVQTNDVSPRRRGRRVVNDSDDMKDKAALAAMAMMDDSGGANGPNDSFYKSRDKFNDPSVPASPSYTSPDQNNKIFSYRDNESVHDIPGEKSWRKSVYGDSETEDKRSSRQNPRTSTPMSAADKRSSRISQVSDRESRPDYNRSSSRENMLDENPNRRRRTNSRELLDENVGTEEQPPPLPPRRLRHGSREILDAPEAPLTSETISLRDSIAKVHEWKQQLPEPDSYYGDRLTAKPMKGRRLDGMAPSDHSEEYFSAHDYPPPPPPHQKTTSRDVSPDRGRSRDQRSSGGYYRTDSVRSTRENSPSYSRDTSPNRLRQRPRRNLSREKSFDNVFDDDKDPRLPNKDFRKSALNKSESNYFENGDPDGVRYRRQDSVPKKGNRKSGSSSDAFSREGSREDIIDDRRPRRDGHTSDSSNFGFNREGSPNRNPGRRVKSRQNSREDMLDDRKSSRPSSREGMIDDHRSSSRSASRHNSREDVLDDRGKRFSARDRPHSLAVSNESLAHLSNEGSLRSVNSVMTDDGTVKNVSPSSAFSNENQALPDVVNGGISPKQLNSPRKDKSGYINQRQDIDHVLDEVQGAPADLSRRIGHRGPRPASTDGYYMDSKNIDEVLNRRSQNLMDTPVPKTPTPLKPSPQVLGKYCIYTGSDGVTKICIQNLTLLLKLV